MSRREFATVRVGDELGTLTVTVDRARLIAYAGASGDHNPIHWSERVAIAAGLPGVIAHGMWVMGAAALLPAQWVGDPTAVMSISSRFTRPVPVPDPGSVEIDITGRVSAADSTSRRVVADLDVRVGEHRVLGKARAHIQLV